MKLHRRDVLVGSAALAACGPKVVEGQKPIIPGDYDHATEVQLDVAAVTQSDTLFPLGVQAGDPRSDGASLWTFAEGTPATKLKVWRESTKAGSILLAKDLEPAAAGDYVRAKVDGLAPATWYRYAFFSSDGTQRGPVGKFRTAFPDDWREPLLVGATACCHFKFQPYRALEQLAKQNVDVFLHLGDIGYFDDANTAPEFRALWKKTYQDPGYRAILESTGWYPVWDDHELANNLDPETSDMARLAIAKQTFYENVAAERGSDGQLWRSYRWGATAEFFVLDCRSERKPSTIDTPPATYLSRAQMDWLKSSLAASTAMFKIVLNSVPITNLPPPLWGGQNDRWQGYPAAREELLQHIYDADVRQVYFISGDFHLGMVMRVEKEGPGRRLWEICAGPGGNGNNPLSLVWESTPQNREIGFPKRQFEYCSGLTAATTLRFDPHNGQVTVRFIDPETGELRFDRTLAEWL